MNCVKCGKPERENKDQYSEYFCNCVDLSKDQFQNMPRIGNNPHSETQGCRHNVSEFATSGYSQVVGMPRRGDGKVYCNSCNALDNFREIYVIEYSYGIGDDQMQGHTQRPVKKQIPALACNCCGNVQLKI